jgi:hypothetical protein
MALTPSALKEILVPPGFLTKDQFATVEAAAQSKQKDILDIIVEKRLMKDENLHRLVAEHQGYTFADLNKERIDEKTRSLIPEVVARTRNIIAIATSKEGIMLGMIDPDDLATRQFIEKRSGMNVIPYYITKLQLGRI